VAANVGLVFDDRYLSFSTGPEPIQDVDPYPFAETVAHSSSPLLVGRAKHVMDLYGVTDRMTRIDAFEPDDATLLAIHASSHLEHVKALSKHRGGGETGSGAPMGEGGERTARLAVGGVIAATEAVMTDRLRRAYALVRPPGHHAMADYGMGYCVYANVAIAVRAAQKRFGVDRVLIVDWDVHHGNGTQSAFYDDPSVLFISIHQDDLYPAGWGAIGDQGEGRGAGFTINVPLPAGGGEALYLAAFDRIVVPAALQYKPDLVIISAGQDASVLDPLARMSLTTSSYREMCRRLIAVADECAGGRVVVAQEGGYSLKYAPYCTAAIAETLCGVADADAQVIEPYGPRAKTMPQATTIGLDGEVALQAIVEANRRYWRL
jgi:acetoin utilization deacetylase AcuC-like enzyme